MTTSWTTRLDPEITRPYGVNEVHTVVFAPPGQMAGRPVVGLLIPECEIQVVGTGVDGEPFAVINRPQRNLRVKFWLRAACEQATEIGASLNLSCDTSEQAEHWASKAERLLPRRYQRVALERMYDPAARCRDDLH